MTEERDRAAVDPEFVTSTEAAQLERDARSAIKGAEGEANYGYARGAVNCGICGRFKARPADTCGHCGDVPHTCGATDAEERDAARVYDRGHGYAA